MSAGNSLLDLLADVNAILYGYSNETANADANASANAGPMEPPMLKLKKAARKAATKAARKAARKAEPVLRVPLGLRVTPEIKKRLDDAARDSGRSQSQEAEMRLEHTFTATNAVLDALDLAYGRRLTGLLLAMAHAAQLTGTRGVFVSQANIYGGEDWMSDPYTYDQAVRAIGAVLEALRPSGAIELPPRQLGLPEAAFARIGEGFAEDLLAAVAQTGGKMVRADMAEAIRERLGQINQNEAASGEVGSAIRHDASSRPKRGPKA